VCCNSHRGNESMWVQHYSVKIIHFGTRTVWLPMRGLAIVFQETTTRVLVNAPWGFILKPQNRLES
jgi:hypothetical protein